jgi:16S rRNA G966 N2-methylase RsmD
MSSVPLGSFIKERNFRSHFDGPPYEKGLIEKTLWKLQPHRIYHDDSILIIEHDRREPLPTNLDGWNLIRQRKIGDTLISF